MAKIKDLTGKRFGRLTVVSFSGKDDEGRALWSCRCDCGNIRVIKASYLSRGKTKSCGCLWEETKRKGREKARLLKRKHGLSGTRLYNIWKNAISRCNDSSDPKYASYGARGITFYEPWIEHFEYFFEWAMRNGYSDGLQIDRIDNEKGYSPDNCRWVTQTENANNKRTNRCITVNGETHTLAEWARIKRISSSAIRRRLILGWSEERAIETPIHERA